MYYSDYIINFNIVDIKIVCVSVCPNFKSNSKQKNYLIPR